MHTGYVVLDCIFRQDGRPCIRLCAQTRPYKMDNTVHSLLQQLPTYRITVTMTVMMIICHIHRTQEQPSLCMTEVFRYRASRVSVSDSVCIRSANLIHSAYLIFNTALLGNTVLHLLLSHLATLFHVTEILSESGRERERCPYGYDTIKTESSSHRSGWLVIASKSPTRSLPSSTHRCGTRRACRVALHCILRLRQHERTHLRTSDASLAR